MSKLSLRKSLSYAFVEAGKWIMDARMVIIPVLLTFIYSFAIEPLLTVSDMRKYLLDLKEQGKTILIASHSSEDIDVLCDSVYEMDKGRLEKIR